MKCRNCGKDIPKGQEIQIKPRVYVCSEDCQFAYIESHLSKPKPKPKQSKLKQPRPMTDREKILDYLDKKFPKGQINFPLVAKQIKNYTQNGYKESGILLTLQYVYDIIGLPLDKNQGIGIVEYYYDEAKNEYIHKQKILKQARDMDEPNVVSVKPSGNDLNLLKYKMRKGIK